MGFPKSLWRSVRRVPDSEIYTVGAWLIARFGVLNLDSVGSCLTTCGGLVIWYFVYFWDAQTYDLSILESTNSIRWRPFLDTCLSSTMFLLVHFHV